MQARALAGEDIVTASGKLGVLDRLLTKLKAGGHRVVLFSQWNKVLDVLEDWLALRGYRCRCAQLEPSGGFAG